MLAYYNATGKLLDSLHHTSKFEMYRSFDEVATYNGSITELASWISKLSKPYIQEFETRTIRMIFAEDRPALVLFNVDADVLLHETLSQFAKTYTGNLIITEIEVRIEIMTANP